MDLQGPYVTIWHDGYTDRYIITAGNRLVDLHYGSDDELAGRPCVCLLFEDVRQTEMRLVIFVCDIGNGFLVEVHILCSRYFISLNEYFDVQIDDHLAETSF